MNLEIVRAGPLTTVQDLGRIGYADIGVSRGGALDPHACRVANILVENDEGAAVLELTLGSSQFRFSDERTVAWCGAGMRVRIGNLNIPAGRAAFVRPGETLVFSPPETGLRAWLAISGGIEVPIILGSRATDLRGQFGGFEGRALRDRDVLPLGKPRSCRHFDRSEAEWRNRADDIDGLAAGSLDFARDDERLAHRIASWSAPADWTQTASPHPTLRFIRGGDWARFDSEAHAQLQTGEFQVTPDVNRMGARLEGPVLRRCDAMELASEMVMPGTVQVPPSGQPILLLGDCQTIGGYPKIAQVITVDLPLAAQLRPGDRVRFREVSLHDAHELLVRREEDFRRFRVGVQLR